MVWTENETASSLVSTAWYRNKFQYDLDARVSHPIRNSSLSKPDLPSQIKEVTILAQRRRQNLLRASLFV